jgi:Protein of unknown function (DUF3365)
MVTADPVELTAIMYDRITTEQGGEMRRLRSMIAAALVPLLAGTAAAQNDVPERMEKSRQAASDFGARLLAALQKAMAEGGPVNAIGVCNTIAPEIAAEKSAAAQMSVGRTSLKLRQAKNAPDAWERRQLENFEARKAAGENPAAIEAGEFMEKDGKPVFRYMKAIPTGPLCLNCHGAQLAPEVAAKLQALYPEDRATGFAQGDLRGAFTITAPR